MQMKVFSVYDSKVEAYMPPIFLRSKGEAIRAFQMSVSDGKSQFCLHPEDYTLFEIGSWDDNSCKFVLHSTPISIGVAIEFKRADLQEVANG